MKAEQQYIDLFTHYEDLILSACGGVDEFAACRGFG